jgi:hypothetical protein
MFKRAQGKTGMNIIENAISTFQNVSDELAEGIRHCNESIKTHEEIIKESEDHISTMNISVSRAEAIRDRLEKFLEE